MSAHIDLPVHTHEQSSQAYDGGGNLWKRDVPTDVVLLALLEFLGVDPIVLRTTHPLSAEQEDKVTFKPKGAVGNYPGETLERYATRKDALPYGMPVEGPLDEIRKLASDAARTANEAARENAQYHRSDEFSEVE